MDLGYFAIEFVLEVALSFNGLQLLYEQRGELVRLLLLEHLLLLGQHALSARDDRLVDARVAVLQRVALHLLLHPPLLAAARLVVRRRSIPAPPPTKQPQTSNSISSIIIQLTSQCRQSQTT